MTQFFVQERKESQFIKRTLILLYQKNIRNVKNTTAYYVIPVTTSKNNNCSFTTTPYGFKP